MGEPFSELNGAGKSSSFAKATEDRAAMSSGLRAERKRRERSMGMTRIE
jgi:hypothetical protein